MWRYQKARVTFVQTGADLATRPQNIDALQNAGVMALLRPLLLDNVASIQQSAALALGRLANYSDELAESVVTHEILPQLARSADRTCHEQVAVTAVSTVPRHRVELGEGVLGCFSFLSFVFEANFLSAISCDSVGVTREEKKKGTETKQTKKSKQQNK